MKTFLIVLYATLYTAVAVSLAIIEVAATRASWPYISKPSIPMLVVFAVINTPLVLTGVAKIVHLVYLHSAKHHANVMRSIQEIKQSPYPSRVIQPQNMREDDMLSQASRTSETLLSGVS